MFFIIGGAYQGKLDHAIETYNLKESDIFTCKKIDSDSCGSTAKSEASGSAPEIDFSCRCIDGIEEFTYACIRNGIEPLDYFKEHEAEWQDSILICDDLFCGVVPLGAELREWRQASGRLCKYLSQQAQQVSRIFCGLEQRLK